MNYNFTESDVNQLPFTETFQQYINSDLSRPSDNKEFYAKCGDQHYRLLAYFSTLFNNCNIIDIGTHVGSSALALSYNNQNTIHTYDIAEKVYNPTIKTRENIVFHTEDLFALAVQENITTPKDQETVEFLLRTPFIFLDVDPHNGTMELDFYRFLERIEYKGFVICDDIWLFKEMRDNFWLKVDYNNRYDLTAMGHFSGTGIFTFAPEIRFPKPNVAADWTLITAYYNLTKCPDASDEIRQRDKSYYFGHSIATLCLPYNLVIYCDQDSLHEIQKIRPEYLKDRTIYVVSEFDDFVFASDESRRNFAYYRGKIIQNRREKPYAFDGRNTASYYLFCMSRYIMCKDTIANNPFKSTHFSWINFCIERMGYKNLVHLEEGLAVNRNKFSTCYIDYISQDLVQNTAEYYKWGRCGMCSGFFTGNAEYMYKVCDLIEQKFLDYAEKGYGHADEQLYSPVYFENPELFEHYYGDYLQMVTNYKYVYDSPENPIRNFIRNSFYHHNFAKCFEACEFVWNSYVAKKCDINEQYLKELCFYYMMSRKYSTD